MRKPIVSSLCVLLCALALMGCTSPNSANTVTSPNSSNAVTSSNTAKTADRATSSPASKPTINGNEPFPLELELPHYLPEDWMENDLTIQGESMSLHIEGLDVVNVTDAPLRDHEARYAALIDAVKAKVPGFNIDQWIVSANLYSQDGYGMVKMNYCIRNKVITNKAVVFILTAGVVTQASLINLGGKANEDSIMALIADFEAKSHQQKKTFASNEEFISEEVQYSYSYNLDKLVYTYQLYFYVILSNGSKVINNDYCSCYILNQKTLA